MNDFSINRIGDIHYAKKQNQQSLNSCANIDDANVTVPVKVTASAVLTPDNTEKIKQGVKLIGNVFNKAREKAAEVMDGVLRDASFKDNVKALKLAQIFLKNRTFSSYKDALANKDKLLHLSQLDEGTVMKKYNAIINHAKSVGAKPNTTEWNFLADFYSIYGALEYEKLNYEDVLKIYDIFEQRNKKNLVSEGEYFTYMVETLRDYDNFNNLSAKRQKEILDTCSFTIPTYNNITVDEAKKISPISTLMKFDYVRDLKSVANSKELVACLQERRKNIPCKALPVGKTVIDKVISKDGILNLQNALKSTDLSKYSTGFNLEYSRASFINDFKNLINELSDEEKESLFNLFQFKINSSNDIINYPNPNIDMDKVDENIKATAEMAIQLINKFMFENKVKLAPQDKALENEMNNIIKAFPEFITTIGKIQHRGDSIDFHTMDDMKRIMSNPEFQQLPEQEKRILTIATLFHDFGKEQYIVDKGHARKSAYAAKEIIKKTNLSFDEKERIFNLINHSHWLVEGLSSDKMAFLFRRPNDLKMAEIFEKADSNSSEFEYAPSKEKLDEVRKIIETINSAGIPLFVDQLPKDDKYYEKTPNGIRYLDFRDAEASVEKYGYPKGTKVKDLKFLCHSSNDNKENFSVLCDDSKEVCLSTSLLDKNSNFNTAYNGKGAYIVSGNNANIICGSKDMCCTGGHRGLSFAIEVAEQIDPRKIHGKNVFDPQKFIRFRKDFSEQMKSKLNLSTKEYTELFENICNLESLDCIPDMTLKTGRVLKKEEVQKSIKEIQAKMVKPRDKDEVGFTNEFVIFNPKIEAQVLHITPENLAKREYTDEVFVLL